MYDEYGTGTDERYGTAGTYTAQSGTVATPTPSPTPTVTPTPTPTPVPAGEVRIYFEPVPDRYDFRRYKVLRVSGSTPTTDPEDAGATEITVASGSTRTTNQFTDDPGTGTWSYSIWAVYDEYGTASDERFSDSPGTITKVVA